MDQRRHSVVVRIAAGVIAAYFLYATVLSLRAEFTHDDLMNVYRAWSYPVPSLLADNLLFFHFTPVYRPFGALVYRVFFELFGFDLFALRVFLLLTLAANILLTYKLCQLLTVSEQAGLFAALISAYHTRLAPLYFNTGTIFDILCFFFYFSALVFYIGIRRRGNNISTAQGAVVCASYILALDSKEVAVSLPLMLLGYELLWHPPAFHPQALWRWVRRTITVWIVAVITAGYILGRVLLPEHSISTIGDYRVTVSAGEYFQKLAQYLNDVFYAGNWFDASSAAAFGLALLAAAVASRRRTLLFGALLFLGGILPVAFIPPRPLSAACIALAGLVLFGAVVAAFLCDSLRLLSARQAWQRAAFWLVFGTLGLFLIEFHPNLRHIYHALRDGEYAEIRNAREQLLRLHPEFPSGSRILIVGTPFPQYSPGYNNLFLIRLTYRDDSLVVDELARFVENRKAPAFTDYNYVLSYEDGRWVDVEGK